VLRPGAPAEPLGHHHHTPPPRHLRSLIVLNAPPGAAPAAGFSALRNLSSQLQFLLRCEEHTREVGRWGRLQALDVCRSRN
jgi:hypothetical protein